MDFIMKKRNVVTLAREIEKKLLPRYNNPVLCNQYAWWMIEAITKKKKAELIALKIKLLDDAKHIILDNWIKKQVEDKIPLQYLLGSVPFLNLEILVEPPVLIPRPETEELCSKVIEQLNTLQNKKLNILDLGTGSGCIALSLAKSLSESTVCGTDISDEALALAQKNSAYNKIKNATFLKSDIYKSVDNRMKFDFIISNPPYITPEEWKILDESVTEWEDPSALIAPAEGLDIIAKIIVGAHMFLKPNIEMQQKGIPQLILEIGYKQGILVKKLLENANFSDIKISKDLGEKDRFASGRVVDVAISGNKT